MLEVDVIEDPAAAAVALDPVRSRLLAELATPASAAKLAERIDMPRQKVTYHLRKLEAHKLIHVAETRKWGGLTEQIYVASASSYIVSPAALGPAASDPRRAVDRISASYLIAVGARIVREVSGLLRGATRANKRLATLSIDTELRFATALERAAFTEDLAKAISELVARYHDASTPGGRDHRLLVMSYPAPVADAERK